MGYQELYEYWLKDPYFDDETKKELAALEGNEEEIEDRFYQSLEFGTAGLRGKIGAGTNRMNFYTVAEATQGLAETINEYGKEAMERGVAIAFDVRHKSKEFSEVAARVLAANDINVYLYDDIRPTPVLSYTIRALGTISGIMITASHNPRDYNGYKAYWEEGSQILEDVADKILSYIKKIDDYSQIKIISLEEGLSSGKIKYIGKEIDEKYLEDVLSMTLNEDIDKDVKIVFSPLNGTGSVLVQEILKERNFKNVYIVPEQKDPDPDFSTVGYPNPEDPKAFAYSIALGKEKGADILIATDPDADRVALEVKDTNGEYVFFNGNKIGALLVNYILSSLSNKGELPDNGVIVKSIVTGDLGKAIADAYGIETVEVLTGFKNVCGKANEYDITKAKEFIMGYEESIGYVYGTFVRDKDAVISSMLIAEMAGYYKQRGKSLIDVLESLYKKYGYYSERLISLVLEGVDGQEKIKRIMEDFRKEAISKIDGTKLVKTIDYKYDDTGLTRSNVLKYYYDDQSWYALRPSGTEPKIKLYIYSRGETYEESIQKLDSIEKIAREKIEAVK